MAVIGFLSLSGNKEAWKSDWLLMPGDCEIKWASSLCKRAQWGARLSSRDDILFPAAGFIDNWWLFPSLNDLGSVISVRPIFFPECAASVPSLINSPWAELQLLLLALLNSSWANLRPVHRLLYGVTCHSLSTDSVGLFFKELLLLLCLARQTLSIVSRLTHK